MLLSPKTGKERIRKNPPCFVPVPPLLKAFPCQEPAEPSLCSGVGAGRFRVFPMPPSLQCPSPPVFVAIWLPSFFQIHIINSAMQHKWDQAFEKEKKYGIQELGCHLQEPSGKAKQREPLYFFVFQQT